MLIEATDKPVRYRFKDGRELVFRLGTPIDLPDDEATHLLARAAGKVRQVEASASQTVMEPASPTATPIYWEAADGRLLGPAVPEFLAKTGSGDREKCWVIVTYHGTVRMLNSDRLRAKPRSGVRLAVVAPRMKT